MDDMGNVENAKNVTIEDIIKKVKQRNRLTSNTKLIQKAYDYAYEHHKNQNRKSGEPYIIHPLQVANILVDIGLDEATICAALLHDVVEDTNVTNEWISKENSSEEIAEMVEMELPNLEN